MVAIMWRAIISILLVGCGCPDLTDEDANIALIEAIEDWDTHIDWYNGAEIKLVDDSGDGDVTGGICLDSLHVEMYPRSFDGKYTNPRAVFRGTILHELGHAHLTCSGKDHSNDKHSVMYYKAVNDAVSWLDNDTIAKVRALKP